MKGPGVTLKTPKVIRCVNCLNLKALEATVNGRTVCEACLRRMMLRPWQGAMEIKFSVLSHTFKLDWIGGAGSGALTATSFKTQWFTLTDSVYNLDDAKVQAQRWALRQGWNETIKECDGWIKSQS